jgi:hypothetical protein
MKVLLDYANASQPTSGTELMDVFGKDLCKLAVVLNFLERTHNNDHSGRYQYRVTTEGEDYIKQCMFGEYIVNTSEHGSTSIAESHPALIFGRYEIINVLTILNHVDLPERFIQGINQVRLQVAGLITVNDGVLEITLAGMNYRGDIIDLLEYLNTRPGQCEDIDIIIDDYSMDAYSICVENGWITVNDHVATLRPLGNLLLVETALLNRNARVRTYINDLLQIQTPIKDDEFERLYVKVPNMGSYLVNKKEFMKLISD